MADTQETIVVGKVEINKKAMRVNVYEVLDELNQLDNLVLAYLGDDLEKRNTVRDRIKRVKRLVNAL